MRSLPNLTELEENVTQHTCAAHKRHARSQLKARLQGRRCNSNFHSSVRGTRSLGNYNNVIVDIRSDRECFTTEFDVQEHSPASSRSARSCCTINHATTSTSNNLLLRRSSKAQRDSFSSSGGASSVRRLVAIVRTTPSSTGPIYSRQLLLRNFTALCLSSSMVNASLNPIIFLQGSLSVWWLQPELTAVNKYIHPDVEIGSVLLSVLFFMGSISALASLLLVNRIGNNISLLISYLATCLFIGLHIYPTAYTLFPAYVIMGIWLGPMAGARIARVMSLSAKFTHVMTQQEMIEAQSSQVLSRAEVIVHKLSRGLQLAEDFGFIVGNIITSMLIWYATKQDTAEALLNSMFPVDRNGERICGSASCPVPLNYDMLDQLYEQYNSTLETPYHPLGISCRINTILVSVFLGFCVMAVTVTATFMDDIKVAIQTREESIRTICCTTFRLIRDTFSDPRMHLIAPISVFIGLEQGFMFTVFSKSYVACGIGVQSISLVFLSLGLLQSIAAYTLSMVLQHIGRHVVIAVGTFFQCCLLLVLFLWIPSRDDPALFYVIPAVWGVCHSIWDTLTTTLIVSLYPESSDAPFAHCYFFRYLGLAFTFGIHSFICNYMKIYGLTAAMILAILPYTWLEIRHEATRRMRNLPAQPTSNPCRIFSQVFSFQAI